MSVLAPLYLLGGLAVAAPLLFHLIRRRVKERTPVSFMMFLPVTAPRLRRHSRIENWLLLLLRALALLLLALAFSRPFLRQAATLETVAPARQWIAVVDTSASMRREDLWSQAVEQLQETVRDLRANDTLAIVTFDDRPQLRLSFDGFTQLAAADRDQLAARVLSDVSPSWRHTDLAAALLFAADESMQDGAAAMPTQIVLISDLQSGAELSGLQSAGWPADVKLQLRRVTAKQPSNAWVTLPESAAAERMNDASADQSSGSGQAAREQTAGGRTQPDQRFRLRVSSTEQSVASRLQLRWLTAADLSGEVDRSAAVSNDSGQPWPAIDLPAGQSRVVPMAAPPPDVVAVDLQGDEQSFDNRRYYVRPTPRPQLIGVFGPLADAPPDRLSYYLQRLPWDTPQRQVSVVTHAAPTAAATSGDSDAAVTLDAQVMPLVVVSGAVDDDAAALYHRYLQRGGRLLYVLLPISTELSADTLQASLQRLAGAGDWSLTEADGSDYAILSRIDFTHPLFAAFADPQFSDFSKIRFWAHRRLQPPAAGWRTVAAFDDGAAALLEQTAGDPPGRLWILTSGWQPTDSQLALSTKFLPLMFELLETATLPTATGEIIRLRPGQGPDAHLLGPMENATSFEQPGVYQLGDGDQQQTVVVNVAESESQTDPLDDDVWQRHGIALGQLPQAEVAEAAERQLRDLELESQQRIWQWLLIGVLGLLATETALVWKRQGIRQ